MPFQDGFQVRRDMVRLRNHETAVSIFVGNDYVANIEFNPPGKAPYRLIGQRPPGVNLFHLVLGIWSALQRLHQFDRHRFIEDFCAVGYPRNRGNIDACNTDDHEVGPIRPLDVRPLRPRLRQAGHNGRCQCNSNYRADRCANDAGFRIPQSHTLTPSTASPGAPATP